MILGQPLTQARWQQKVLFRKVRSLALAHDTLCTTPAPVPPAQSLLSTIRHSQTNRTSPTDYFSDTLLGPLAKYFADTDMTGKWLTLNRGADGSYALSVLD